VTKKRATARGEALEPPEAREGRRFWFQVEDVQLKWLPLSETAFLLWVLAGLVVVWLVVAIVLLLL
jgi:hypothetical protein